MQCQMPPDGVFKSSGALRHPTMISSAFLSATQTANEVSSLEQGVWQATVTLGGLSQLSSGQHVYDGKHQMPF